MAILARVPITMMGYRCERCGHEWIPRREFDVEPRVCPKCKSAYWNRPRKAVTTYEDFRDQILKVLSDKSLTWTEIRTATRLPQAFPNNQWVHKLEKEVGLRRQKDPHGIIHWSVKKIG